MCERRMDNVCRAASVVKYSHVKVTDTAASAPTTGSNLTKLGLDEREGGCSETALASATFVYVVRSSSIFVRDVNRALLSCGAAEFVVGGGIGCCCCCCCGGGGGVIRADTPSGSATLISVAVNTSQSAPHCCHRYCSDSFPPGSVRDTCRPRQPPNLLRKKRDVGGRCARRPADRVARSRVARRSFSL